MKENNKKIAIIDKIKSIVISPVGILVLSVLLIGLFLTYRFVLIQIEKEKDNVMLQASMIAHSIDQEQLNQFTATEADLNLASYSLIKKQLRNVRLSNKDCLFLYILGYNETDKTVFFFIDSQIIDSDDYAPPGLVYDEVSDRFREIIKSREAAFVGPVSDRWGTMVSALIPIMSPDGSRVIATLGMDIEANDWYLRLWVSSMLPMGLLLLIIVLIVLFVKLNLKTNALRDLADVDFLTNLHSRKKIVELAESILETLSETAMPFSLLLIEIDNFKEINDRLGHQCGDLLLKEVAACLKKTAGKTAFAGRMEGEEFIVLLPDISRVEAENTALSLKEAVASLAIYSDRQDVTTPDVATPVEIIVNTGVGLTQGEPVSFEGLYAQADKALFLNKNH